MERYAIGIDLGGTKISAALISESGQISVEITEPTHAEQGAGPIIDHMADMITRVLAGNGQKAFGIGIGAAGMTDSRSGEVIHASNLGWRNVPLKAMLCDRLDQAWCERLWVDKDTNAAALGEMYFGAARGFKHLLYVTVGTGVGGGMVIDGKVYHGVSEGSGDFGHLVMQRPGRKCGCGKHGCLETLSSGPAIELDFINALNTHPGHILYARRDELTAREIVESARSGDILAMNVLEQAGRWLGRGMALYVDLNNPECIVVGGGVAAAGDLLLEPARQELELNALPDNAAAVDVLPAGLGPQSGVIGAASLVWQGLS